jgi:iron complex outermembrane receptor protein
MRHYFRLFPAVLLSSAGLFAGEPAVSLAGRVIDPSGAVVASASVRLYGRNRAQEWRAGTDGTGQFRFEALPPGEYLLEARTEGLDQASPLAIQLSSSRTDVELRLDLAALSTRVLVTAAATPQSTEETGKAMDVVDIQELAGRQVISFPEAVRLVPGLRVQQLGGPGSMTRILTRGLRAADTGVLIDGARFRDVASVQGDATAFLGDLQLIGTDRVEVLRGLGSSLYGTNATAGVINLVSDTGGGVPHGELSAEGGGLGLFRALGRFSGGVRQDRLQYSAGVAEMDLHGGVDGIESVRNTSGQGYLLWRPASTASLSGRLLAADSTVGVNSNPYAAPAANLPVSGIIPAIPLDPAQARLGDQGLPFSWGNATFGPNFHDPDNRRFGRFFSTLLSWNQQVSPRWNYRLSYHALDSRRDNRDGPAGSGYQPLFDSSSLFAGRTDTAEARADASLTRWNLATFGYEFERESYRNDSADRNPDPAQRVNASAAAVQSGHSVFAQDQFRLLGDRLQFNLAGRFEGFRLQAPVFTGGAPQYQGARFDAPPNAWTGEASAAYFLPGSGTKLRAHLGNGYRSPTLYERLGTSFFWGEFSPLGDPRLRPERTASFDAGVDQYFAGNRYRVAASYFYTRLREVITYAGLSGDPYGRWGGYVNAGGGLARGAEVSVEARPFRSTVLRSSYTYTNADERRSSLIGGSLRSIRVFPHMFSLIVQQQITRRWQVSSDFLGASDYVSGSFFVGSGNRPYLFQGPRRLDAATSYTLPLGERRSLRFFVRAENLLNQRYFEDGFRTPRIWASAGLRFAF